MFRVIPSLLLISLLLFPPFVTADLKKDYKSIQKKLEKSKKRFLEALHKEKSIIGEIASLNKEIDRVKRSIKRKKMEIVKLKRRISVVKRKLKALSLELETQRKWFEHQLRYMQRYGYEGIILSEKRIEPLVLLLSSESIEDFTIKWYQLKEVMEYEYKMLQEYEKNLRIYQSEKIKLQSLLRTLKTKQNELLKKEENLRIAKKKKRTLLASVRSERMLYKRMLSELTEDSRRIRRMLLEQEKRRKKTEDVVLKGFRKRKRRLSWPVKGRLALQYGSHLDPRFKTPVFRNGIYISTKYGSKARAIYDGRVVYADVLRAYGNVVILEHGDGYYSVYANLSEILVKKGQLVKEKEVLGTVGESLTLNSPALYFEIRYRGKPLNPIHWLRKG